MIWRRRATDSVSLSTVVGRPGRGERERTHLDGAHEVHHGATLVANELTFGEVGHGLLEKWQRVGVLGHLHRRCCCICVTFDPGQLAAQTRGAGTAEVGSVWEEHRDDCPARPWQLAAAVQAGRKDTKGRASAHRPSGGCCSGCCEIEVETEVDERRQLEAIGRGCVWRKGELSSTQTTQAQPLSV